MSQSEIRRGQRELTWLRLQSSKRTWTTCLWLAISLLLTCAYFLQDASLGSTAGKAWGLASLVLLAACIALFFYTQTASDRVTTAANRDGLFILEALGEYGDNHTTQVTKPMRDLLRSIGLHLKAGNTIPDYIRSEAIIIAELAMNKPAATTYDSAFKSAGVAKKAGARHRPTN